MRRPGWLFEAVTVVAGAGAMAVAVLLPVDAIVDRVVTPAVRGYLEAKRGAEAVVEYRVLVSGACGWLRVALATWGFYLALTSIWFRCCFPFFLPEAGTASARKPFSRADGILLLPLVLAALIGAKAIHGAYMVDEIGPFLSNVKRGPVITAAHIVSSPTRTHTAYALAQWVSYRMLGESETGLRLPALVFGLGTILLLYSLGRRLLGRPLGLLAATILALSSMHLYFCSNARAYTLLAFTALAQSYAGILLLERETRLRWATFILAGMICGYAHLYGILSAGLVGVAVLIAVWARPLPGVHRWERTVRLLWVGGFMLASLFVLYATGIPRQLEIAGYLGQTLSYYPFRPHMGPAFLRDLASEFSLVPHVLWAVVLQWVVAVAGAVWLLSRRRAEGIVLVGPTILYFAAMWVSGKEVQTRYFFVMLPVFCFLCAAGLLGVGRWGIGLLSGTKKSKDAAVAVVGLVLVILAATGGVRDLLLTEFHGLRRAVAFVREQSSDGERVVALTDSAQTAHYYWDAVETVDQPDDLVRLMKNPPEWVLYAGEAYIKVDVPELYRLLRSSYERVLTVPGRYPLEGTAHVWRRISP